MYHCARNHRASNLLRPLLLTILALALVISPFPTSGSSAAAADPGTVVVNGGLDPKVLTIEVGTAVTWHLTDGGKHRIRSTTDAFRFDSGGLEPGSTYSVTFVTAGTYPYRDEENKDLAAYQGSIVVLVAGGGATTTTTPTGPGPTPAPTTTTVSIPSRTFSPSSVSIAAGSTVVWRNTDRDQHTVTANGGSFDSGTINPGGSYQRTFIAAGTFSYFCDIHPSMVGVVSVSNPTTGGTLPPPPPPPPSPTTVPPGPATTQPGGQPPAATGNAVDIVDFDFRPATLTVAAGTAITWSNRGQARHTVAATDGSFRSPDMRAGATFQRTFATPGTYAYFCDIHPEMTGTIAVTGAGGEPPPPAPPATAPPPVTAGGDVRIADFSFSPRTINITAGRSLTFVNTGAARHSATARDGSFDTGLLSRGGSSRQTFATAGTFLYFCTIHPDMTGTVLVSGADGEPPPPPNERPAVAVAAGDVMMVDFAFDPLETTVAAGATVGFVNAGVAPHTATARDGSFDTGIVRAGQTNRLTLTTPGTYPFYCTIHPNMTGLVAVVGADGVAPPPQAGAPPSGPPAAVDVEVRAESFEPADVRVAQGGTVTWTVTSLSPHVIEADDGSFVSDILATSRTFTHTFDTAGTWTYHDGLTGRMHGSVTVVADPGTIAGGSADDGASAAVKIVDLDYEPREVTVNRGATVTWSNVGQAPHTVTARAGDWTSELLQQGDQFARVFGDVGRFEYFCTLHPNMVGTVVVGDASGATAPQPQPMLPEQGSSSTGSALLRVAIVAGLLASLGAFALGRRSSRRHLHAA